MSQRDTKATPSGRRSAPSKKPSPAKKSEWALLVYKVPSEPSRVRVSVWRELKRLGALYLQQAACILPARPETIEALANIRARIEELGGTSFYFEVPSQGEATDAVLIEGFREMAAKDYAEIVEECETKFVKEIEFERFRENYTYEEAEEIRQDFEKLQRWHARVISRDWFASPGREEVESWLEQCLALLQAFEEDVYERVGDPDISKD